MQIWKLEKITVPSVMWKVSRNYVWCFQLSSRGVKNSLDSYTDFMA